MNKLFRLLPLAAALGLAACGGQSGGGSAAASGGKSDCGTLAENEVCVKIATGAPETGGIAHWGKDLGKRRSVGGENLERKRRYHG